MRSRYLSSCATAFFITSADCSTNGRISSPAPNLSPTSFIAGRSTSFSVGTAPIFSTRASIQSSTPSFLRRRMWKCSASSGSMPAVGSAGFLLGRLALRLEVLDEALRRVLAAVEDEVVGELALSSRDLRVGRDVLRVDHREVESGLDAVVQEDASSSTSRAALPKPKETFETPSEVCTPGSSALIARIPSIVSIADGLELVGAGRERERERVEDQQLRVHPVLVADVAVDAPGDVELALRPSCPSTPRRSSARSARRRARGRAGRPCRACRGRPRG